MLDWEEDVCRSKVGRPVVSLHCSRFLNDGAVRPAMRQVIACKLDFAARSDRVCMFVDEINHTLRMAGEAGTWHGSRQHMHDSGL